MDVELARIRRLRLHTILVHFADDLADGDPHPVPPEVAARAVRHLRRRGRLMLLAGVIALLATFVLGGVFGTRAEDLLSYGSRTSGVVVDTSRRFWLFNGSISVRYTVDGVQRVGRIGLSGDNAPHQVGDQVTVVYDSAIRNESGLRTRTTPPNLA